MIVLNIPLKNAPVINKATKTFGDKSSMVNKDMQMLKPTPPNGARPSSTRLREMMPATQHPKPMPTATKAMITLVCVLENPMVSGQWMIGGLVGGNVGEVRHELAKRHLLTKIDQLHYRAYKKNVITFESLLTHSPRVVEYIEKHGQK